MNQHKTGLVLGSFVAIVHILWSILIAFGWAQPLMDFVYRMHSLDNFAAVMPFDVMRSIGLVILTFFVGYIAGNLFAFLYNKFQN